MQGLKIIVALAIALAVAACSINADARLIPLSEALTPFAKESVVVIYSDTAKPQKLTLRRDGMLYRLLPPADQADEEPIAVAFHKLPGQPEHMIVEVDASKDGKEQFVYVLGKLDGDVLGVVSIKTADGLEAYGELTGGKVAGSLMIRTRKNLEAAMKQLIEKPDALATQVAYYRIFDASRKAEVAKADAFLAEREKLYKP